MANKNEHLIQPGTMVNVRFKKFNGFHNTNQQCMVKKIKLYIGEKDAEVELLWFNHILYEKEPSHPMEYYIQQFWVNYVDIKFEYPVIIQKYRLHYHYKPYDLLSYINTYGSNHIVHEIKNCFDDYIDDYPILKQFGKEAYSDFCYANILKKYLDFKDTNLFINNDKQKNEDCYYLNPHNAHKPIVDAGVELKNEVIKRINEINKLIEEPIISSSNVYNDVDDNFTLEFSSKPCFVHLSSVDVDVEINNNENIYYFMNYYTSYECRTNDNPSWKIDQKFVIGFKDGYNFEMDCSFRKKYVPSDFYFRCLKRRLSRLDDDWIICSIPGHNQVNTTINSCNKMLEDYKLPKNIKYISDLLIRTHAEPYAKHDKAYGYRDYNRDLETLRIKYKYYHSLENKNIIIIDDITTSGSSFIAARKLFIGAKVAHVLCFALAKTYDEF